MWRLETDFHWLVIYVLFIWMCCGWKGLNNYFLYLWFPNGRLSWTKQWGNEGLSSAQKVVLEGVKGLLDSQCLLFHHWIRNLLGDQFLADVGNWMAVIQIYCSKVSEITQYLVHEPLEGRWNHVQTKWQDRTLQRPYGVRKAVSFLERSVSGPCLCCLEGSFF